MKLNIKQYLIPVATLLFFIACDEKDPIYKTDHPEHGRLTLTADFSQRGVGIEVPTSYMVTIGDFSDRLYGETNKLAHLFTPGKYTAYVYNTPSYITVDDAKATVATTVAPADTEGSFIEASPEWLFTCSQDTVLYPDSDQQLRVLMEQQVRELTLIIESTGSSADSILHIDGYLSGVAGSLKIDNSTHETPSNVKLTFRKITENINAGKRSATPKINTSKWSATVRLLGMAGMEQKLKAAIVFKDSRIQPIVLDSDMSAELADFNTDKRTPLTLTGKVETPTEVGSTATILDWKPVKSGTVVAN